MPGLQRLVPLPIGERQERNQTGTKTEPAVCSGGLPPFRGGPRRNPEPELGSAEPRGGTTTPSMTRGGLNPSSCAGSKDRAAASFAASQLALSFSPRLCRTCSAPLTKAARRGRWPVYCDQVECAPVRSRWTRMPAWDRSLRICAECQAEYTPRDRRQVCCSDRCGKRIRDRRRPDRGGTNGIRRAKHHGVLIAPVNRRAIFERDGWICQLCGGDVDPELRYPHPLSASIDHRIPLADLGDHAPWNVQLAHLTCNRRKARAAA